MHAKFEVSTFSLPGDTRRIPKFKSRSPGEGRVSRCGGSVLGEQVFVVGPAEASKEDKWPQPADT